MSCFILFDREAHEPPREMPSTHTVCIAVLLVAVLLFDEGCAYRSTKLLMLRLSCQNQSCGDCSQCPFGTAKSPVCGEVCAKGPGDMCGGHRDEWGICGEGMFCNCNRCDGCSVKDLNCPSTLGLTKLCIPGKHTPNF
ncbi:neuroparsin-A-like isoform X1 [Hylaeus volcanicus]|uniref:neuroparsin-A-like isoform X1 n=2 Tax=Hylaeus volcanicus TaxID=313075 RepID=UPI0023B7FD25|nr:neuroparsin-A-like isoform X1 [Hylaeus volcanicus]